jgi:salicylate hydroxylase
MFFGYFTAELNTAMLEERSTTREDVKQPLEVAIIGGGIAGLTLALGLLARGITPTILERGHSFREIGAGIGFTPNAEAAMKILDPGIHDAFKRVTVQNGTDWFFWMDASVENEGEVIHKMYLGERGFEGCARADFLDELVKSLPAGTVQFGKRLEEIVDVAGMNKVEIKCADGSSTYADVGMANHHYHSVRHNHR